MSSITLHELYNCGVKVWVCVGAMNCERVHYCACVSECIGGPRWGRETAGVRVWECVFVRVLECRRDTWLMLWTRLRDSVSVLPSSLLQPQTHAGTHTTSFSLSFILFFLPPLSHSLASLADNTWVFFYQPDSFSHSTTTPLYLRIAIYLLYAE